jgi:hypothetical protein
VLRLVQEGTVIFTTWWDSPAKRCQIIFSKMFVKKFFQLVKPFLANLHSTSSNIYSYMHSMTPKNFWFFFGIWEFKIRRILRWFQICGNNRKKIHPEKVICQTLLQVSSIEEENLWFCTLFLAVTFLLANYSHFSQQFRNQRKILHCFDTHIQILQRKSFYVILALFWNFKARFARNGSKFWKTCFIKVS